MSGAGSGTPVVSAGYAGNPVTLAELLQHAGKYLDDRTEMVSGDPDELWDDELITRLLNQAQKIHARRAWSIIDIGHASAGLITLQTGVAVYSLHKSVLRVLDATLSGDTGYLSRADDQDTRRPRIYDFGSWWPDLEGAAASPGRPRVFASDTATRKVRVYPTPRAAENGLAITLRVARLPVTYLDLGNPAGSPEIPEDYHMDLADYAIGKCLVQPNVDPGGRTEGRQLIADFNGAVQEARRDRQRAALSGDRWAFSTTTG